MNEIPYRIAALLLFVMNISLSGYFRRRADARGGRLSTSEGRGLVVVLRLLGLAALLPLLGYLVNPDWVAWARLRLPRWARLLGLAGGAASVPLAYATLSAIGDNISPTHVTRQDHVLVTHGPYRWVRHPLYATGLLFIVSEVLITSLWWLAAAAGLPLALLLLRTRREEANLVAAFGNAYRAYQARTKRFIPFLY